MARAPRTGARAGFARWAALSGAGVIELARGAGVHALMGRKLSLELAGRT